MNDGDALDLGGGKFVPLRHATIDHFERARSAAQKKVDRQKHRLKNLEDVADALEAYRADHPE
jgi:hypothetical protein